MLTGTPAVDRVLTALQQAGCNPQQQRDGWTFRCPCAGHKNGDRNPSASLGVGDDGRALLHCHGGHDANEIAAAVGINMCELFADSTPRNGNPRKMKPPYVPAADLAKRIDQWHSNLSGGQRAFLHEKRGLTDATIDKFKIGHDGERFTIPIRDEVGRPLFVKRYLRHAKPKFLRWPKGAPSSLFGEQALADVPDGATVIVTESELDAILLVQNGFNAVSGTADHWSTAWPLSRFDVVVAGDADSGGHQMNQKAAKAGVRILHWPDGTPVGTDPTDFLIDQGHDLSEFRALIDAAVVDEAMLEVEIGADLEAHLTELGLSQRFIARHREELRYCFPWSTWFCWDGQRWARDRDGSVLEMVKAVAIDLHREAADETDPDKRRELSKFALRAEKENTLRAAVSLSRSSVPVLPEQLDQDVFLLNTPTGTVDLRTEQIRPHRREDLITKLCPTPYDPAAAAPAWERFLLEIMGGDAGLCLYLARAFGYALTGCCREHVLFMLIGRGGSGKSTMSGVILDVLGPDYGAQIAPGLLFHGKGDAHPTGLADLEGKRVAITHELDSGTRLAEGRVKSITGGDKIKARKMRQDFSEFQPTHTTFLFANSRPRIWGVDDGIWRRVRLVPFLVPIPKSKRDGELREKLNAEAPGILAWMVQGARDWLAVGLDDPPPVLEATAAYRSAEDDLGDWLDAECELDDNASTPAKELYESFVIWHQGHLSGEPLNQNVFGRKLSDRGLESKRTSGVRLRTGVRLL